MEEPQITRREVIDNLREGIVVLDIDFRVTDMNRSSRNIFQVTANEIIGIPVKTLIFEWDSLVENYIGFENISECETNVKNQSYKLRVSNILDDKKEISGYVLFLEEISPYQTAKPKLEITLQDYHDILDTLHDFYFEADTIGVITYVNQAFANELGRTEKADVIAKQRKQYELVDKARENLRKQQQKLTTDKL